MAKLYSMHRLTLLPGVAEEDFEAFVKEEIYTLEMLPGWQGRLLKGDRGKRAGLYLWVWEIDDRESLTRFFPEPNQPSGEFSQFIAAHPEYRLLLEKLTTFTDGVGVFYTDYALIE